MTWVRNTLARFGVLFRLRPRLCDQELAELAELAAQPRISALAADLDIDPDDLPLMDATAVTIARAAMLARDGRISNAEAMESIALALDVVRTGRVE
jgi:hypothetical protein